jgi:hypothetical protein
MHRDRFQNQSFDFESPRHRNEPLQRSSSSTSPPLQDYRRQTDYLQSGSQRFFPEKNSSSSALRFPNLQSTPASRISTGFHDEFIRSLDAQLAEREDHISSLSQELKSCYARLGESASRFEQDRLALSEKYLICHLSRF